MSGLHVQAARVQIVCAANGGFVDFVSAGEESTKWPKVSRDGLDTVRAKIWSRSRASMSSKEGRMALRLHLAKGRYSAVRWNPELSKDASRTMLYPATCNCGRRRTACGFLPSPCATPNNDFSSRWLH